MAATPAKRAEAAEDMSMEVDLGASEPASAEKEPAVARAGNHRVEGLTTCKEQGLVFVDPTFSGGYQATNAALSRSILSRRRRRGRGKECSMSMGWVPR